MSTQDKYLTSLEQFIEIAQEIHLNESESERAEEFRSNIEQFTVLIPLVGSFNAGKTSLVNAYLKREESKELPTDIVPQTAIATEIRSAAAEEEERIEIYGEEDKFLERIDIASFQRFEKEMLSEEESSARYAKAMLHASVLENNGQKVLVDMPGLDSGLMTHNAAIQRYLPLGSYFILVVDADHGALRESEIRQLHEFFSQEIEFAVLINKIDKKKADAHAIVDYIAEQVDSSFGKTAVVRSVSAHDQDTAAFRQILDSIDFDHALRGFWRRKIVVLFDTAIQSLNTRYTALNVSSAENNRVIDELEDKKQAIEEKLRQDEREIRGRYSRRAVDKILRGVRNAIRYSAPSLVQTFQARGQQALNQEINELVRQTLNDLVDEERSKTLREIVERYQPDIDEISSQYEQFSDSGGLLDPEDIEDVVYKWNEMAPKISKAFEGAANNLSRGKTKNTYLAISGVVAASTAVVAPWLEVVIILAPYIIEWIGKNIQEQRQQEQLQKLKVQIESVIAPRIASELRAKITEDYDNMTQEMLSQLREQVQGEIEHIQADINQSRQEIEEDRHELEQRKAQLRYAINRLIEIKKPLEDA